MFTLLHLSAGNLKGEYSFTGWFEIKSFKLLGKFLLISAHISIGRMDFISVSCFLSNIDILLPVMKGFFKYTSESASSSLSSF